MGNTLAPPHMLDGLEEYIKQTQQAFESSIAQARTSEERKAERLQRNIVFWEIDSAQKYFLVQSTQAMIARLKPDQGEGHITALPGTGIWMALDAPRRTNIYFSSIPLAASSYVEYHRNATLDSQMADLATCPWLWTLDVSQMGKTPISYVYHAGRGQWTFNASHRCPTGRCEFTGKSTDGWAGWYMCERCRPDYDYWTSWFPVALMAVQGEFAETEERQEYPSITTHEKRSYIRPDGKPEVRTIAHTWHIVTFDVSVKHRPAPVPETQEHEIVHPTWLEQAIENETMLYVAKHIEQTQRTFRHERYVNMRGKTIDVRAHDKRIPMSILRLKQTLYRAIASKEEKP